MIGRCERGEVVCDIKVSIEGSSRAMTTTNVSLNDYAYMVKCKIGYKGTRRKEERKSASAGERIQITKKTL